MHQVVNVVTNEGEAAANQLKTDVEEATNTFAINGLLSNVATRHDKYSLGSYLGDALTDLLNHYRSTNPSVEIIRHRRTYGGKTNDDCYAHETFFKSLITRVIDYVEAAMESKISNIQPS